MYSLIYNLVPLENGLLKIKFLDGSVKIYDVKQLCDGKPFLNGEPAFAILCNDAKLFSKAHVDLGRDAVVWDDFFDLAAYELWTHGVTVDASEWSEEDERKANPTPVKYYVEKTAKKLGIEVFVVLLYTNQFEAPEIVKVRTQRYEATVELSTRAIIDGEIPNNVLPYVMRWLRRNRRRLNRFWTQRRMEKPA